MRMSWAQLDRGRLPVLIGALLGLELLILLWALGTTKSEFVFDKCARNSGRVSSLINLGLLLIIGWQGFKRIHGDRSVKEAFRTLITLFATNHVVHLYFVLRNFSHHQLALSPGEHVHGVLTFACVFIVPLLIWRFWQHRTGWDLALALHLFNTSYFIMKTFYSKIKPDHPAYHNQLGIWITAAAMMYVLYRLVREYRTSPDPAHG
jgi:hypothetical protein